MIYLERLTKEREKKSWWNDVKKVYNVLFVIFHRYEKLSSREKIAKNLFFCLYPFINSNCVIHPFTVFPACHLSRLCRLFKLSNHFCRIFSHPIMNSQKIKRKKNEKLSPLSIFVEIADAVKVNFEGFKMLLSQRRRKGRKG